MTAAHGWLTGNRCCEVLLDDSRSGTERASVFHASMADTLLQQARLARSAQDISEIGLSGGVFQNRVLTELAVYVTGK